MENARLELIIVTTSKRGRGTDDDPVRLVKQYWSISGVLLFENDEKKSKT